MEDFLEKGRKWVEKQGGKGFMLAWMALADDERPCYFHQVVNLKGRKKIHNKLMFSQALKMYEAISEKDLIPSGDAWLSVDSEGLVPILMNGEAYWKRLGGQKFKPGTKMLGFVDSKKCDAVLAINQVPDGIYNPWSIANA